MNIVIPDQLQAAVEKEVLDSAVAQAKGRLLKSIKRSAYAFRVDCGGCNACEIEIFASITPVFDAERFGIKVVPTPRHADIMIYTGAVTRSMRMPALRAYEAAPNPKIVISYGACGCTGGIFHDNYCVWGGTNQILPVDLYIPGCPPSPAQTIYGFAVALGLLDQKLHSKNYVEGAHIDPSKSIEEQGAEPSVDPGDFAPIPYVQIPYELRVRLECEARMLSGYRQGHHLASQFMDALLDPQNGVDAIDRAQRFLADQSDPRRIEVFTELTNTLLTLTRVAGHAPELKAV